MKEVVGSSRRTLRILLVGEGNLSFAHALVKRLSASLFFVRWRDSEAPYAAPRGSAPAVPPLPTTQCSVLATTFDRPEELKARYPEVIPILAYFEAKRRVQVRYLGGVNATELAASLAAGGDAEYAADLIIFNNPHIGIEDLYRQRSLISHFFASVSRMPRAPAERGTPRLPRQVVLTLCDEQPQRWAMLDAAARSGLVCVAAVPLVGDDFPEYENKRHQSDAKFPYKAMVQHYFAESTMPMVQSLVRNSLAPMVAAWPLRVTTERAVGVEASDWTRLALSEVPADSESTHGPASDGEGSFAALPLPALHRRLADAWDGAPTAVSASAAVTFSLRGFPVRTCFPLLHPKLFYSASESLFAAADGDAAPVADEKIRNQNRNRFSPYVDLRMLPRLYELQAMIEVMAGEATPAEGHTATVPVTPQVEIPSTLNAAVLGRPLTQRESVKLARYVDKMKRAAAESPGARAEPSEAPPMELRCPHCTQQGGGGRDFGTQKAYDHHILTRHSGVSQLQPIMYACAHRQMATSQPSGTHDATLRAKGGPSEIAGARELSALLETELTMDYTNGTRGGDATPVSDDCYCAICDVLFRSRDAFDKHLAFLSPQATVLVCSECEVPRGFPDERALEQHRTLKHIGCHQKMGQRTP